MPVLYIYLVTIMVSNAIQFPKGLSEVAFQENYGTEARC